MGRDVDTGPFRVWIQRAAGGCPRKARRKLYGSAEADYVVRLNLLEWILV